jgi:hypothetical protein
MSFYYLHTSYLTMDWQPIPLSYPNQILLYWAFRTSGYSLHLKRAIFVCIMADFVEEISENDTKFFRDFKLNVVSDYKTRTLGSCKVCKKLITGDWKPTRVTSNFDSLAKFCSPGNHRTYETERGNKMKNLQQDEMLIFP